MGWELSFNLMIHWFVKESRESKVWWKNLKSRNPKSGLNESKGQKTQILQLWNVWTFEILLS